MTTIEVHQTVTVRRPSGATLLRCPACLREVEMVPLGEAALLAGVSLLDICRRVGADDLHFIENADGGLVCTNSLLNKVSPKDGGLNSEGAGTLSPPAADTNDAADQ